MRYHFRFINKKELFKGVSTSREYSVNVYGKERKCNFESIFNLVAVSTVYECYENNDDRIIGIYDENDKWDLRGNKTRIINITQEDLALFARIMNDSSDWRDAILPLLHSSILKDVIKKFDSNYRVENLGDDIYSTVMWDESLAKKRKLIVEKVHFPIEPGELIYTGANIGVANPLFKSARKECKSRYDYDSVDLLNTSDKYLQRCKYYPEYDINEFGFNKTSWESFYNQEYRFACRRRLNVSGERTFMPTIIPPKACHVDTVFGMAMNKGLVEFSGYAASILYDFYIKMTGKSDVRYGTISNLPVLEGKLIKEVVIRSLLLNCLNKYYDGIWKDTISSYSISEYEWSKKDSRLVKRSVKDEWKREYVLLSDYERRQALLEIDVLTAMLLGMSLKELITIYRIQFPVLKRVEAETWYDRNGRIVFTTSSLVNNIGVDRPTWENTLRHLKPGETYSKTYMDDTQPGGPVERTIEYVAPFDRCDREEDYETAWKFFNAKYGEGGQ